MAESRWSFSQKFIAEFQSSRTELGTRIEDAAAASVVVSKQQLDSLNLQLAILSKSVIDATGSIPNFDQRNCETQLKDLERRLEHLRKASVGTSKFAFKRKAKEVPRSVPSTHGPNEPVTASLPTTLTLSSYSQTLITPENLPDPQTISVDLRSELSVYDLDNCILNLLEAKQYEISALHVRNVKNSILILPPLQGSIILHDISNCVVAVEAHQFRMHASKDTDVYLSAQSNPIIENCSGISFAPYPSVFSSADISQNPDIVVLDFSHIKSSTLSPNWNLMAEDNMKSSQDWQSLAATPLLDTEQVLQWALPQWRIPG
ncbi:hypothetical protein D9757_012550 [Collybiopsis confluens]|uniref:C-CAP/cofactor C-like domain-containing protein n=1 Tax=Collybiopsis confluens TaxID=2823264 RepID=A0A8H5D8A7_9AGAR|nr:hypothetical protein D9757_012550 [Collybiopsis confluens]